MAALSITAASVRCISNVRPVQGVAGEAITQGQPVFLHTDNKYYLTDADDTDEDILHGIAITPADADGDRIQVVTTIGAIFDMAATTTKGAIYYPGATAGSWHPVADVTTSWNVIPGLLATDTSGTCEFIGFTPTTDTIL